jgi:hypothetical protein
VFTDLIMLLKIKTFQMTNLESSSIVKSDKAALAHDAATLGPIAEAKNPTCTVSPNSKTRQSQIYT